MNDNGREEINDGKEDSSGDNEVHIDDYNAGRIVFLVNAAYDNDDGTGKSFQIAIGLIQSVLDGGC